MEENKYLEIDIDKTENPYADIDIDESPDPVAVNVNYQAVADKNPAQHAKELKLAEQTGIPRQIVSDNFDEVHRNYAMNIVGGIDDYPVTGRMLGDPDLAPLIKDDIKGHKNLEHTAKRYSRAFKALESFESGIAQLYAGTARSPNYAAATIQELIVNPSRWLVGLKPQAYPPSNPVADWLDKQAEAYAGVVPELQKDWMKLAGEGNWGEAGEAFSYQMISQMPQLFTAFAFGPAKAGEYLGVLFGQKAANRYKEALEKGLPSYQAVAIGGASGAAEVVSEKTEIDFLKNMGKEVYRQFGKAGAKEIFKTLGKAFIGGAATEAGEEAATQIADSLLDYSSGLDPNALDNMPKEVLGAAIGGAFLGGVGLGPASFFRGMSEFHRDKLVQNQKDAYLALAEGWSQSKLSEVFPEKQAESLNNMLKEGPLQDVYVDPEAVEKHFNQAGRNVTEELQKLDLLNEYNDAKEYGGFMKVSTGKWAEKFVGTDAYAALVNDVKFNPQAITANELQRELEEQAKEAEIGAEELAAEEQIKEEGKAIVSQVAEQLKAIKENPAQAQLYRAIEVMAKARGITPEQLWKRYSVRINREGMTPTQQAIAVEAQPEVVADKVAETEADEAAKKELLAQVMQESKEDRMTLARNALHNIPDVPHDDVAEAFGLSKHAVRAMKRIPKRQGKGSYTKEEILSAGADSETFYRRLNQSAFHGTPHKFEKFSLHAIGTGEGAQAFGYGLYFASSKGVAEWYRTHLTKRDSLELDGEEISRQDLVNKTVTLLRSGDNGISLSSLQHAASNFDYHLYSNTPVEAAKMAAKDARLNEKQTKLLVNLAEGISRQRVVQRDTLIADLPGGLRAYNKLDQDQKFGLLEIDGRLQWLNPKKFTTEEATKQIREELEAGLKNLQKEFSDQSRKNEVAIAAEQMRINQYQAAIDLLNSGVKAKLLERKGRTFEVDIPESHEMLNWDKPINEQPGTIKAAITPENLGLKFYRHENKYAGFVDENNKPVGPIFRKDGAELSEDEIRKKWFEFIGEGTGKDFYKSISDNPKRASEILVKAGVAGIQYLDANSRTAGTVPTYNFVVFDDARIQIKRFFQQRGQEPPRAEIAFGPNNRTIDINLLRGADKSSFIHESSHLITMIHQDIVNELKAIPMESWTNEQKKLVEDLGTLKKWAGIESDAELTDEAHEKIATGFEQYILEGKAPIPELKSLFQRFQTWLLEVYKGLMVRVDLTDDVRQVFDRLLATQEELNRVNRDYNNVFTSTMLQGMSAKEATAHLEALDAANAGVHAEIRKKLQERQDKIISKEWKAERSHIVEELKPVLDAMPIHQAVDKMRASTMPNGEKLTISIESLKSYGEKVHKGIPKDLVSKKGMDVSTVATMLGFDSANDLVTALTNFEEKAVQIEKMADLEMERRYPEFFTQDRLSDEVVEAYHNADTTRKLRMQLEWLAKHDLPELKRAIRKVAMRVPSDAAVREQAARIIGAKRIEDINPKLFERLERKAAKEAGSLLAKGDVIGAFNAKRIELLNNELYKSAKAATEQVKKYKTLFKRILKGKKTDAKTRDMNMVLAAKEILGLHGIGTPEEGPMEYTKLIREYDPETAAAIDALVLRASKYRPFNELSLNEFIDMAQVVKNIWGMARETRVIEIKGERLDLDTVREKLQAELVNVAGTKEAVKYKKTAGRGDKIKTSLLGVKSNMTRVESWVDFVTGGDINGAFRLLFWDPVSQAATEYRLASAEKLKELEILMTSWGKLQKPGAIRSDELGFEFKDKTELIMAVLHSGNDSNISKLLRGRGWGEIDADGSLDRSRWDAFIKRMWQEEILTKADYDFAQSIWNLLETLKPGAQKAHKKMHGDYFSEITANEIQTPWGVYKGGYIPARVDVLENEDAKIRAEKEEFEKNNNGWQFPTTGRGFTLKRLDSYAAELSLDLGLLASHVDSVLRFTHIEPTVKAIGRINQHKEFRAILAELDPTLGSEMINKWLQRTAQQKVVFQSDSAGGRVLDSMAHYMRANVATQVMMGNLKNALEQVTGLAVAATKVDTKYLRNASVTYVAKPKKSVEMVKEKSKYMNTIYDSSIYETREAIRRVVIDPNVFQDITSFTKKHTYFLQAMTQNVVNTIVWVGAYDQAIANEMSEEDAIRSADSAVRLTQGSVLPEDISHFETGTATKRMFIQFAGYFNMLANLNQTEFLKAFKAHGGKAATVKAFSLVFYTAMIPSAVSLLLQDMLAGKFTKGEDDDEPYLETWWPRFFGQVGKTYTAMIPFAGQAINAVTGRFDDNMYNDRISLSPALSVLESNLRVFTDIKKIAEGDEVELNRVTKDIMNSVGFATGLPLAPIAKPVSYGVGLAAEEIESGGALDTARGFVTGR